jgi:hypothetical protein
MPTANATRPTIRFVAVPIANHNEPIHHADPK